MAKNKIVNYKHRFLNALDKRFFLLHQVGSHEFDLMLNGSVIATIPISDIGIDLTDMTEDLEYLVNEENASMILTKWIEYNKIEL